MRRTLLLAATLLVAAAPTPKPAPLLGPDDLDIALVLPPPPRPNSLQAAAELAERDGDTKNASIFTEVLGAKFDLARLPATSVLMALVRASEKDAVDRGKAHFQRPRPYIADPTLKACKRNDDPLSSYPSGHTSMASSMGETLARLIPEKAGPLLARAAAYGQSRIVCEQHYRSDVSAGQALGLLIAERLMTTPTFRAAFDLARQELVAAEIARR